VERWPVPYWHIDAAFTAMLVQLAAVDEGLGVLFFGIFDHTAAVRQALGIPDDRQPIGTIAIGHPAGDGRPGRSAGRARRTLDAVVHRGAW
jgi:nitroreductase